jgi:hypothetical protein
MTSIPAMLSLFQNEWDALALQTYTLQQNLFQVRQELSTALYENDAAVRVIAQLTKERDEARSALSQISLNGGASAATNGDAMQVDSKPLPQNVVEAIETTQARYGIRDPAKKIYANTESASPRLDGNGLYQKNGQPLTQYRPTPPSRPHHHCFPLAPSWLYMNLAMLH